MEPNGEDTMIFRRRRKARPLPPMPINPDRDREAEALECALLAEREELARDIERNLSRTQEVAEQALRNVRRPRPAQ